MIQDLASTISNILNRLTSLENKSVLSGWALGVSIVSAVFTGLNLLLSYFKSKTDVFHSIKNNIESAKSAYSSSLMQVTDLLGKAKLTPDEERTLKLKQETTEIFFETLISNYDTACNLVLDKKIDRKQFDKVYRDNIIEIVKDDVKRFDNLSKYQGIYQYYFNIKKNKRR